MAPASGGAALVAAHRSSGVVFEADGVLSFVRSEGAGVPVVLLHGLPASSFLYRKMLPELAAHSMRGIAFDLPGMGLAARPADFDYRICSLGAFCAAAVDVLGLDAFHLVVHDAGGPVGFEMLERRADRIQSLTILNTVVSLPSTPFPGELFARFSRRVGPVLGSSALWRLMMRRVGVLDPTVIGDAEIDAHRLLALGDDDGVGYLNIMRVLRAGGGRSYQPVVDTTRVPYPVQIIWGAEDPILSLRRRGLEMLAATGLESAHIVAGRHFLQEERASEIAGLIARFVQSPRT